MGGENDEKNRCDDSRFWIGSGLGQTKKTEVSFRYREIIYNEEFDPGSG